MKHFGGLARMMALAILATFILPFQVAQAQSVFAYNPSARILADMARKGYSETVLDMHIKVLGGYIQVNRTLVDAEWEFNQHWAPAIATSGCGGRKIMRGQYEYFYSGTETVSHQGVDHEADIFGFFSDRRMIAIQDPDNPPPRAIAPASGSSGGGGGGPAIGGCVEIPINYLAIRWEDSSGNSIEYDGSNGRILRYGDRNDVQVAFDYDANGNLEGVNDHFGTRIVTLQYVGNRVESVTDYTNRQVQYIWSADGSTLDKVVDVRGEEWTYTYNSGGRLTKVVDPEGRQKIITLGATGGVESVIMAEAGETEGVGTDFSYAYDQTNVEFTAIRRKSGGREESVTFDKYGFVIRRDVNGTTLYTVEVLNDTRKRVYTLHNGNKNTYEYDERNNLIRQTNADGSVTTMTYNEYSLPLRYVDEVGTVTLLEYDSNGNLERQIEGAGTATERVIEIDNDQYGRIEAIRHLGDDNTQSVTWRYTYDDYGNMRTETDALDDQAQWTYDVMGNQLVYTDRRGKPWSQSYDDAGNLTSSEDPLGQRVRFDYDGAGNLFRFTDPELHETEYEHDARDNVTAIVDALDGRAEYAYDDNDRPTSVRNESGTLRIDTNDTSGRLVGRRDGAGNETLIGYGNSSISTTGSYFQRNRITFPTYERNLEHDRLGRVNRSVDSLVSGDSLESLFEYDSAGRMIERTDPRGKKTSTPRDSLGRMSKIVDDLGDETQIAFDDRDNVIAVTNPRGKSIQFEYDANDRIAAAIMPLGQRTSYFHDADGNRTRIEDANGQRVDYDYDDANRIVSIEHYRDATSTTPDRTHSLSYTPRDSLETWDDGETSGLRTYDELGRLKSETVNYGPFELTYSLTYNANSTIDTFTDADGTVYRYLYDDDDKPQGVIIPGIGTIAINDFEWLVPKKITMPGGTTEDYQYTSYMETNGIDVSDAAGNSIASRTMTYDAARNPSTKNTEEGDNTYAYDDVDRLVGATRSAAPDKAYTYDGMGNRLTLDGGTDVWQYDDNNRLLTTGTITYSYDDNGNVTSKDDGGQVTNYFYDVMNRLERVEDEVGTVIATYGFDLLGRRVWKEVAGVRTYFLYHDSVMIGEYDETGTALKTYGYLPGRATHPVYVKASNGYNFYHNDHLGTPYMLTDRNGAVTWKADADPFGRTVISVDTITNNLRFAGQYFDAETGLHYNYYRFYDPSTGRYMTPDPIGLWGGINTYEYVYSNPLMYIDPFGLWALGDPLPQGLVDGVTGFGDSLSFGITGKLRDWMGIDGGVDKCSDAYKRGEMGALFYGLGLGGAHLGRHALNVGLKQFFRDPRKYKTVQGIWSRNVGGYKGKYELHHWFKADSLGGTAAGWNLVAVTPRLNNMMSNGGALFNAFRAALITSYAAAASGIGNAGLSAIETQDPCLCE